MDLYEMAYDYYLNGKLTYREYEAFCVACSLEPMPESYVPEDPCSEGNDVGESR